MFAYVVDGIVHELIPAENPDLPGFSVEQRYPADFVIQLIECSDEVEQNWIYDPTTGTFSAPEEPEVDPDQPVTDGYTVTDQEVEEAYKEGVNDVD